MNGYKLYSAGHTDALEHAVKELQRKGCTVVQRPDAAVSHLLLSVPSFNADTSIRGGGSLEEVLAELSPNIVIVGGNLQVPLLKNYKTIDLLQDPLYLAENANITAHCAVKLALSKLPVTLQNCHILVIGWGRIGKCLAALLKNMGAIVTVAARKESDRAIISALGYDTADTADLGYGLLRYRVVFNTVPLMILPSESTQYRAEDCIKIDLASTAGIEGSDVIQARGLPNRYAYESSGALIARTILRLL